MDWRRAPALAAALAAVGAGLSCERSELDRPLAEVNGARITGADLLVFELARRPASSGLGEVGDAQQDLLRRVGLLRELVDHRVLLRRASEQGLAVADREVEGAMERYRLAYATPEGLHEALERAGVDLASLREELRRQLTVEMLLNREIASKVRVGEDEMRAYYDSHQAAFAVPEQQLRLAQILVADTEVVPVPNLRNDDATDLESARRKIRRIREELADGADFEEMALHYSEDPVYAANGGDMGFVSVSALEKTDVRLRRALVDLQPGDTSPVVQTGGEFRILRLVAVEPAGRREFGDPDVQESIRAVLANRKEQLLRTALLDVERNRSKIRDYLAEGLAAGRGLGN